MPDTARSASPQVTRDGQQAAAAMFGLLGEMHETLNSLALWRRHATPAPVAADGQRLMRLAGQFPDLFRSWLAHGRPMPPPGDPGDSGSSPAERT